MSTIVRLALPLTLWLVSFSTVYAVQALGCSRHWPATLDPRGALLAAIALAGAVQALTLWALVRNPAPAPPMQRIIAIVGVVALVASVWTLLPAALTTACL